MSRERKYRRGERMLKRNNLIQTKDLPTHLSVMPTSFLARTQLFPVPLEVRFSPHICNFLKRRKKSDKQKTEEEYMPYERIIGKIQTKSSPSLIDIS